MNPDSPIDPRSALEFSLTALLLGELPHEQAAALHQKLAQDAELAKLYERLKQTINLVRETVASPAAQTADQPTPLKLSDQRRQKLLQHFKTVAPKQFAPPRRSAIPWLVPVGIAAGLVVILGALLLPALAKAKSKAQSLAFRTWSLSEPAASAPLAPPVAGGTRYYLDLNRNGRTELPASKGEGRVVAGLPAPPPADVPARPARPAGTAIVLPQSPELADAGITRPVAEALQPAFAVSGTSKGFYDDSLGQGGGMGGGGASGGSKGKAVNTLGATKNFQTQLAAADSFFALQPEWAGALESPNTVTASGDSARMKENKFVNRYGYIAAPESAAKPATPAMVAAPVATGTPAVSLEMATVPSQEQGTDNTAGALMASRPAPAHSGRASEVKVAVELPGNSVAAGLETANNTADTTALARRSDRFGISESLITAPQSAPAAPSAGPAAAQPGESKPALAGESLAYPNRAYFGGTFSSQKAPSDGTQFVEQNRPVLRNPKEGGLADLPRTVVRAPAPSSAQETAVNGAVYRQADAIALRQKAADIRLSAQGGTAPSEAGQASVQEKKSEQPPTQSEAVPALKGAPSDPPVLGDVPLMGRLFRSTPGDAEGSVKANIYSKDVVGYNNMPLAATNAVAGVPAESSSVERYSRYRQLSQLGTDANGASRVAGTPIMPPPTPETSLALKDSGGKGVRSFAFAIQPEAAPAALEETRKQEDQDGTKTRPYFEAKRQLDELQRVRQVLDTKIASEKIDTDLPKTMMVEIVDKAVPASSPSSTLWHKIRGKPGEFESTARIKIERDQSDISGFAERGGIQNYDPYFIQTEFELIESEVVLGKVAEDLNLKQAWAGKKGAGDKLTTAEAVQLLKKSLDLRPVRNTSLLEIGVKSDKPEEAAKIANAVADAYRARRLEQRAQLARAGTKALEERYAQQTAKVMEAQKKVDDLRVKLNISDAVAIGDGPSPLMTADTLRKLEALRIESKAELVRQETLLGRLKGLGKELGPEGLAQAIPTAASDGVLSSLLEQQTVAEQRRLALEKQYGPTHPEVLKIKALAEDLHSQIKSRVDGIMLGLDARVHSLSNSFDNLEKEVAKANADDVAQANKTRSYFQAKRTLEELQRFREVLGKSEATNANQTNQADVASSKPAASAPVPQPEVETAENAFSTFSLNVSDVSFKLAAASLEKGVMPEPATVRSEEFINAFDYRDPEPPPGVPVAFAWERAQYPFAQNRDLLRFSIKTAAQGRQPGHPLNVVLLLDNSGSMERADRVRIIHEALRVLAGQLQPQDKFSVVTFARTAHLWVDGVPGSQAAQVAEEVSGLTPEGGTNLEDAMNLAYQTALRHYLANGVNRVVLLTDGAANLGNVEPEALKQKVEAHRKQGIALDCFGIGWEGYNDDLLEVLSRNGDGRYAFLNSPEEVASEFAAKLAGALQVAASDVKVQVEFNPARVTAYRQIGYAKHQLTKEQFRDNTVNAAQIGAAEAGNALYTVEVNPAGTGPLCTVRVRFRIPGTADYREHAWDVPFTGNAVALEQASPAMRLAATASALSEWLASSPYAGEVTPDRLLGYLSGVPEVYGADARPKKVEWMIRQAKSIAGK